jgi:hypothetical protein
VRAPPTVLSGSGIAACRFRPIDAALLIGALGCWMTVAAIEQNMGIALVALTAVACVTAASTWFGEEGALLLRMFAWGYLARTVIALVGYYQGQAASTAFWTGSNSDSERFFVESKQSFEYAMTSFEDPGFPFVNYILARVGDFFGGAHYLLNVQLVVVSGALFGPLVYLVASEVVGRRYAVLAGWIGTLHPTDIAYASGLMRDAVAAATGWAFVAFGMRAVSKRATVSLTVLSVAFFAMTWMLRSLSALILLGALAIWLTARFVEGATYVRQRTRRLVVVGTLASALLVAAVAVAVVVPSVGGRLAVALFRADILRTVQDASPEALNQNGVTARLSGAAGMLSSLVLLPFWIVAPFPFFAWSPPVWLGGPIRIVDLFIGIGGLVNQAIFVAYLGGVAAVWRRREFGVLMLVVGLVGMATLVNIVTLGQIRYTMLHTYPLVFTSVAVGWQERSRSMRHLGTWIAIYLSVVVAVYFFYGLLKFGMSLFAIAMIMGPVFGGLTAVMVLHRVGRRRSTHPSYARAE